MAATAPGTVVDQPPPVPVRRFTVAEYHRLAETGVLTELDRVELLEGWIVPQMVHNPPHDNAVELADEALRAVLPAGWSLRIQSSIMLSESEPEPDLAIVRGSARDRAGRHPTADEVSLVVEVADTSLRIDREVKVPLYARSGIASYWIVNLVERQVEVHSQPTVATEEPGSYGRRDVFRPGDTIPMLLEGSIATSIAVSLLLP